MLTAIRDDPSDSMRMGSNNERLLAPIKTKGFEAMNSLEKMVFLEKISKNLSGRVILVEGKKDKQALELLLDAKIFLAVGKPEKILEKLPGNKVVLLFDFDEEGKRKTKFFKVFLEENGFSVDSKISLSLRSALGFLFVEDAYKKYLELKGELDGKDVH